MLKLIGSIKVGADKSFSHRSLVLLAMSIGKAEIRNLLESEDVLNTLNILKELGVRIIKKGDIYEVFGNGTNGFIEPKKALNCGNSGTTARLLIGAVSSNKIKCTFTGDSSLSSRDMSRITKYLERIGADTCKTRKAYLPIMISGSEKLLPMTHVMEKASAQIKSALILAGLNIHGKTKIVENQNTRDHTEKLMKYLKIKFKVKKLKNGGNEIELNGPYEIKSKNITIPGDPSSAAFFITAALIIPRSKIVLKNVMLNPTRIAYLKILKKMGGKIQIKKSNNVSGEVVGNITARYSKLKGIKIKSSLSPFLIDEYPIISIAATQAKGTTIMYGLEELRHKESDRINSIETNLKKLGYFVKTENNNLIIKGGSPKTRKYPSIRTFGDHRIAMSFSILNLLYDEKLKIDNKKCISISYPLFENHLEKLKKKY